MPHKRVKKALKKVKKAITGRKTGDRLPDLPFPDVPTYGPAGGLVGLAMRPFVNPLVAAAIGSGLGTYALMENTEKYWGPPVEAHAQWTARQWEEYQNWYEQNVRSLYAGSEIDPESPLGFTPRRGMMAPEVPVKQKRKVSTANKATSRAYKFLQKGVKGKMTQKKCCVLLKKAQAMASKANPNTKSRIGKGRSKNKTECRKMRKSLWGTSKRY
jgi:hypothetical protein